MSLATEKNRMKNCLKLFSVLCLFCVFIAGIPAFAANEAAEPVLISGSKEPDERSTENGPLR